MCPLKCEQARPEMQQWIMRRLPTADSIVEIGIKVGHELRSGYVPNKSKMVDSHTFENEKLQNALSMITNGDVITSSTENVLKLPKFHTL